MGYYTTDANEIARFNAGCKPSDCVTILYVMDAADQRKADQQHARFDELQRLRDMAQKRANALK